MLKHASLAPILLTLTLRDVYNVKDSSRSLILISEDSPRVLCPVALTVTLIIRGAFQSVNGICFCINRVTNFIQLYLHQFFDDSHSLNGYGKPLKQPFNWYQSRLEAISIGQDIRQINW